MKIKISLFPSHTRHPKLLVITILVTVS